MWEAIVAGLGIVSSLVAYLRGRNGSKQKSKALEELSVINARLDHQLTEAHKRIHQLERTIVKVTRQYNETLSDSDLIKLANSVSGVRSDDSHN